MCLCVYPSIHAQCSGSGILTWPWQSAGNKTTRLLWEGKAINSLRIYFINANFVDWEWIKILMIGLGGLGFRKSWSVIELIEWLIAHFPAEWLHFIFCFLLLFTLCTTAPVSQALSTTLSPSKFSSGFWFLSSSLYGSNGILQLLAPANRHNVFGIINLILSFVKLSSNNPIDLCHLSCRNHIE